MRRKCLKNEVIRWSSGKKKLPRLLVFPPPEPHGRRKGVRLILAMQTNIYLQLLTPYQRWRGLFDTAAKRSNSSADCCWWLLAQDAQERSFSGSGSHGKSSKLRHINRKGISPREISIYEIGFMQIRVRGKILIRILW